MKIIDIDTKQMWDNFCASNLDVMRDDPEMIDAIGRDFLNGLRSITTGDMGEIRKMFSLGDAFKLISDFNVIDSDEPFELRVSHKGKLIGVILDSEMRF